MRVAPRMHAGSSILRAYAGQSWSRPAHRAMGGQGVTRIVAGTAKGRRLLVPDRGTRPTSERAREALFNTLRSHLDVEGASVLDLFARTGAVGLAALSRGAARVMFVERDRTATVLRQRNIDAVGLPA